MKLTTMAMVTALALTSSAAMAQMNGTAGYGTVTAPSVGSYTTQSVGTTNVPLTWRNTGPAAPLPSAPTFAPIPTPAPVMPMSGARR
jgi:hypothetical protein